MCKVADNRLLLKSFFFSPLCFVIRISWYCFFFSLSLVSTGYRRYHCTIRFRFEKEYELLFIYYFTRFKINVWLIWHCAVVITAHHFQFTSFCIQYLTTVCLCHDSCNHRMRSHSYLSAVSIFFRLYFFLFICHFVSFLAEREYSCSVTYYSIRYDSFSLNKKFIHSNYFYLFFVFLSASAGLCCSCLVFLFR